MKTAFINKLSEMSEQEWANFYLYTETASEHFKQRVSDLVQANPQATYKELNEFDLIHPGKHSGVEKFFNDYCIAPNSYCFEIGVGYGGTSRYLACEKGVKIYGIDYLGNLIEASNHANALLQLSNKVVHEQGDITTHPLPANEFDVVIAIGIFMHVGGIQCLQNTMNAMKPGALLYYEDYLILKSGEELSDNDKSIVGHRHMQNTRTVEEFKEQMRELGMEIVEFEAYTVWSEECWARAEGIITGKKAGTLTITDDHYFQYVHVSPQLVCDLGHYTEAELRAKFPNLCEEIDAIDLVYRRPKIANAFRIIARKS